MRESVGHALEERSGMSEPWKVTLTEISLPESDVEAVLETLRSGWLTMGPKTLELEKAFCAVHGLRARRRRLERDGRAPHRVSRRWSRTRRRGDRACALFVADAHAGRIAGGETVLADCVSPAEPLDGPSHVESLVTERTKAIIAVHMFGYPADIEALSAIADERGIALIEDCAESDGGKLRDGSPAGTAGVCGCFSFFSKTQLGVGEGGIMVTDSEEFADRAPQGFAPTP